MAQRIIGNLLHELIDEKRPLRTRGPTKLISPLITLKTCGNSSMWQLADDAPDAGHALVVRASPSTAVPSRSASFFHAA